MHATDASATSDLEGAHPIGSARKLRVLRLVVLTLCLGLLAMGIWLVGERDRFKADAQLFAAIDSSNLKALYRALAA